MKHRQVKHYGYEFDYDHNGVRYDTCEPIPKEFEFILNAIYLRLKWRPDQITVNKYLPGQGKNIQKLRLCTKNSVYFVLKFKKANVVFDIHLYLLYFMIN